MNADIIPQQKVTGTSGGFSGDSYVQLELSRNKVEKKMSTKEQCFLDIVEQLYMWIHSS